MRFYFYLIIFTFYFSHVHLFFVPKCSLFTLYFHANVSHVVLFPYSDFFPHYFVQYFTRTARVFITKCLIFKWMFSHDLFILTWTSLTWMHGSHLNFFHVLILHFCCIYYYLYYFFVTCLKGHFLTWVTHFHMFICHIVWLYMVLILTGLFSHARISCDYFHANFEKLIFCVSTCAW